MPTVIYFHRTILDKDIGITINESIYNSKLRVFQAVFHTYDTCNRFQFLHSQNRIYIFDEEYSEQVTDDNCFYHFCFTGSPNWVAYLIAFLEICYEQIMSCTIFHGTSIEYNDKSLLILGNSKAGKSTLTHYLIQNRQAYYIEDDMVYLTDGIYFGFGMPISLRNKCENNKNLLETNLNLDKSPRYIYEIPCDKIKSYVTRIDFIIFPEYSNDSSFSSRRLTGYGLTNKILENVRGMSNIKLAFEEIQTLLSTAQAFCLRYSSSEDAANFIDNLVL